MSNKAAIELDQEDIAARLQAVPELAQIKVLLQRRGVIESDVATALEALNSQGGKTGAVIIVLMPTLRPDSRDAEGPRYYVTMPVQVIAWPPAALGPGGAGMTAEEVSELVRQHIHFFQTGRGNVFVFDGQEPTPVKKGNVSWTTSFRRLGVDDVVPKVAMPAIAAEQIDPQDILITLSCATSGAALWYTLDGSYPAPGAAAAQEYATPFLINSACTLRVLAVKLDLQQSDCALAEITPAQTS